MYICTCVRLCVKFNVHTGVCAKKVFRPWSSTFWGLDFLTLLFLLSLCVYSSSFDLAKALPLEPFCLSTLCHIFEFDLIIYRQYLQDFLYTGYIFLIYKLYIHVYLLPRTGNHMSLEIYQKYQNI